MTDLITAQTPTADHVRLALSLMADGAHMVLSGVPDDPSLATYSFPGHVSKALHAQLADAQAAVALALGDAAQQCEFRDHSEGEEETEFDLGYDQACDECAVIVRALAPADGLAAVEALRARERESAMQALASMGQAQEAYEAQKAAETALAAMTARVAELEAFIDDFATAKIDALRYSPPYGSSPDDEPDPVVDAETVWAWQADAKAALSHIKRGKTNG